MHDSQTTQEQRGQVPATLGERLRALRRRRGLTLDDVGRRLGVTRACVCQWESGKSYPLRKFIPDLARALDTSVSYLVAGDSTDDARVGDQAADLIWRARKEIAEALSFDVSRVRIEIDVIA